MQNPLPVLKKHFLLFCVLFLGIGTNYIYAQQITKATGGTNISADTYTSGTYTTLSGPVITETSAGQISLGTIVFVPPQGFEWDTGGTDPTVTIDEAPGVNGKTKVAISFNPSASTSVKMVFDVTSTSDQGSQSPAQVTFNNIRVRPTTGTLPNSGNITNTGASVPSGNTNYGTLTMVAGAASKIRIETSADGSGVVVPVQDITAGNSITVYAVSRDQNDNFLQNIAADSWSLINTTGGVTASDLTVAGDNKSATLSSTDVGTGKIQATETGLTSVASGTITVKAAAPASLTITTQPSPSATAGQAFSTQPVLKVLDIYGNVVADDFNTLVTANREIGTGTLQGDLTKLASQGVITFTDLAHNIADSITIEFSASGFTPVISDTIDINPAAATQLSFSRQPPNSAKNVTLNPGPIVQIEDTFGNNVPQSGTSITMSIVTGPTNFKPNSVTIVSTDAAGQALFNQLVLGVTGTYTMKATASGLSSDISELFDIIDSGVLAKFDISNTSDNPIGAQTAGQSFTIKLKALDGSGSLLDGTGVPEYNDKAFITSAGNMGTGLNDSTTAFSQGVVTHSVTLNKAGQFTISASAQNSGGNNITSQSSTFTVNPAAVFADSTVVTAAPASIEANGVSTALITVQLKDQFDNNITQGGATVVISTTGGTLLGSVTDNGDGTYTQTLQAGTTAQTVTITVTVNGNSAIDDATVTFTPGGLDHFNVEKAGGGNIGTQNAGQAFTIRISARDANDNLITTFNGQVDISSNKTMTNGDGIFSLTNGILDNHSVTITGAGQNNVTITADNVNGPELGTSNSFTVNPGFLSPTITTISALDEVIENTGSTTTTITVQAKDQFGNNILTGGATVVLSTTAGTLQGGVTDNGDGTYTQTLQSSASITTAIITGTINGNSISDDAEVFFAEFNTWISGSGGPNASSWGENGNWTLGTPTSQQAVLIPNPTNPGNKFAFPIIKNTNPNIAFLIIEAGATLNVNAGQSITISEDVTGSGSLIIDNATASISGDITIANLFAGTSTVTLNGSAPQQIPGSLVTNILNISNTSSEGITIDGYVNASERLTVNNNNTFTLQPGSLLEVYGDVTGSGTFLSNDATITIGGDVTVDTIDVSNSDVTFDPTFGTPGVQNINNIDEYRNLTIANPNGVIHNGDATVSQQLTINSGSSFEVTGNLTVTSLSATGGTLKLQSDFSATNVIAAPQKVVFTGANSQTLIDFDTFNDLTVNKTANNVLATTDVDVYGTLTLTSGDLIIGSGKSLLAPTRSIAPGSKLRFQRNLPSRGWYMLSSPVAAAYSNFLDSVVTQGYPGAFYSTGSGAPGDTLQPNVLYYVESYTDTTDNERFRTISNATNNVPQGRGHFVYVFGTFNGSSLYTRSLPRVLDVSISNETPSTVNFNVTYSGSASQLVERGFNLVGNPYGATIDWDENQDWTKTNMTNVIYVWDHTASGGNGDYLTWNGTTGSLGNGLIAPFQGFWVKTSAANPVLKVEPGAQTTGGTFYDKTGSAEDKHASIGFKLESGELSTRAYISFSERANRKQDRWDAYRLVPFTNTFLKLFSTWGDGTQLVINHLPIKFGKPIEIPLYVGGSREGDPVTGSYTLSWPELVNVPAEWEVILIDQSTGREINIAKESFYTFDVMSSKKSASNAGIQAAYALQTKTKARESNGPRFTVKIIPGSAADGLPDELTLYQNFANPFGVSTKIRFGLPLQGRVKLIIYDILGRRVGVLVDKQFNAGYHTIIWDPNDLASGVYLYVLRANGKMRTKKMTYIK